MQTENSTGQNFCGFFLVIGCMQKLVALCMCSKGLAKEQLATSSFMSSSSAAMGNKVGFLWGDFNNIPNWYWDSSRAVIPVTGLVFFPNHLMPFAYDLKICIYKTVLRCITNFPGCAASVQKLYSIFHFFLVTSWRFSAAVSVTDCHL